jgi:uncharacterized DUF497 family protein
MPSTMGRRRKIDSGLELRLHVLCFTLIDGDIRVISFRKANSRKIKAYEQAQRTD